MARCSITGRGRRTKGTMRACSARRLEHRSTWSVTRPRSEPHSSGRRSTTRCGRSTTEAHVDHERGCGRNVARRAGGTRRTLRLQDDAGVHRPGRRDVPRRGRPARGAAVRAEIRAEVAWPLTPGDNGEPASAGCPLQTDGTERRRSRTYRAVGCTTAPVLKTGWATGPVPLPERDPSLRRVPPTGRAFDITLRGAPPA
jgi:hypothetical protein